MAGTAVNVGTGVIVMFLRSGFVANLTNIVPYDVTVQTFKTTHMAQMQPVGSQQGGHPYTGSKFGDMGDLQIAGQFNPQTRLPDSGVFETVVIKAPLVLPDVTAAYWMGTACLVQMQPDGPYDGLMEFTAQWKWSGTPVFVAARPGPGAGELGDLTMLHQEGFEYPGIGDLVVLHQEGFES